jgi:hypothetical protein
MKHLLTIALFTLLNITTYAQNELVGDWKGIGITDKGAQAFVYQWSFKADQSLQTFIGRKNKFKDWGNYTWEKKGKQLVIAHDNSPIQFSILELSSTDLVVERAGILYRFKKNAPFSSQSVKQMNCFTIMNLNTLIDTLPKLQMEFIRFGSDVHVVIYKSDGSFLGNTILKTMSLSENNYLHHCHIRKLNLTFVFTTITNNTVEGFVNGKIPFTLKEASQFQIMHPDDLASMDIIPDKKGIGSYTLKPIMDENEVANADKPLSLKDDGTGRYEYFNIKKNRYEDRPIKWTISNNGDYLHIMDVENVFYRSFRISKNKAARMEWKLERTRAVIF